MDVAAFPADASASFAAFLAALRHPANASLMAFARREERFIRRLQLQFEGAAAILITHRALSPRGLLLSFLETAPQHSGGNTPLGSHGGAVVPIHSGVPYRAADRPLLHWRLPSFVFALA